MSPRKKNIYLCAAYIAHPYLDLPDSLILEEGIAKDILRILRRNKVLFRSFTQYDGALSPSKKSLVSRLLRESKEMAGCYEFYKVLMDELLGTIRLLNGYDIETLFIKSCSILPLDSDNFDLLIQPHQLELAESVLRRNGFAKINFYKEPYKVLYRQVKNGKDYLALHLHTKIAWHGVEFLKAERVWRRRVTKALNDECVGFVHPNHHVLITLAHAFIENASLKLSDISYLVDALYGRETDFKQIIPQCEEAGWDTIFRAMMIFGNKVHHNIYGFDIIPSAELIQAILNNLDQRARRNIERLNERIQLQYEQPYLPTALPLKSVRVRQLISHVGNNKSKPIPDKIRGLSYLFSLFLKGFLSKSMRARAEGPSLLISVIGTDGVGKTTHTRELVNDFKQRGYNASRMWARSTFHLPRLSLGFTEKLVEKLAANHLEEETLEKDVLHHVIKSSSFLRRSLIMSLLIEHAIQLRFKLLESKFSNHVTVCDRYIHDTLIDSLLHFGENHSSSFSNALSKMMPLVAPKPSLLILLTGDHDILIRRRPHELNAEAAKLKLRMYETWGKRWGAYVLNTKRSKEQNHLDMLETALRAFYGKN